MLTASETISTASSDLTDSFRYTSATDVFEPLEIAHHELCEGLHRLPEFRKLAIPEEFRYIVGNYAGKELTLTAWAFAARGIGFGRIVRISGNGTWINNVIIYNEDGFTIPIIGIEILAFREKIHMVIADMFPLCEADAGIMDELCKPYQTLGEDPKMPVWGHKIFSRSPIFRKPGKSEAILQSANAMREVGSYWLLKVNRAQPAKDSETAQIAVRKRNNYIRSHAEDEPANPFLGRAFGFELGQRLVEELLFPTQNRNNIRGEFNG